MILSSDQYIDAVTELERRQRHAINTFKPTEVPKHNQLHYLSSTARYRLLFGGNQSGKSITAGFDCACYAIGKHPYIPKESIIKGNIRIWVIAPSYITIKSGIYRHLKDFIPDWMLEKKGPLIPTTTIPAYIIVKRHESMWLDESPATCEITFMSAQGDDRAKFQAEALARIYIDEEVDERVIEELEARTLITGGTFSVSATLVESYEWVLKLEQLGEKDDPNVSLTRLDTEYNPYIDQQTLSFLMSKWSDDAKEYRIHGKSKRSFGLVYNTWSDAQHWINPFTVPTDWPRFTAMDPGIRTFAVLWVAVSPDNRAFIYRELYAHNEPLYEVAIAVKEAEGCKLDRDLSREYKHFIWTGEGERIVKRVIDDKENSRLITGEAGVMDQLISRYSIMTVQADKSVSIGIDDVRMWLEPLKDNKPGCQVFNTLMNFYAELKSYRIRTKKTKREQNELSDKPIKKNDHLMDCWRYLAREKPRYSEYTNNEQSRYSVRRRDNSRQSQTAIEEILGDW